MRPHLLLISLLATACFGSGEKTQTAEKTENGTNSSNSSSQGPSSDSTNSSSDSSKPLTLTPDQIKAIEKSIQEGESDEGEELLLVPSPAEMQKTISNAGLKYELKELVDSSKQIDVNVSDKNEVAVRTGVVIAKMLLTVESSEDDVIFNQFDMLKTGFTLLEAGGDLNLTIDRMVSEIKTKTLRRDDLVVELDWLSGAIVPELEYEAGGWVVPLIQAGSWLKGANLVATAIIKQNKYDVADRVLRQPQVVKYFIKYVKKQGGDKAPEAVVSKLLVTLESLHAIAKKDTLVEQDVKEIQKLTNSVLELL
jgi:hypothetical protein